VEFKSVSTLIRGNTKGILQTYWEIATEISPEPAFDDRYFRGWEVSMPCYIRCKGSVARVAFVCVLCLRLVSTVLADEPVQKPLPLNQYEILGLLASEATDQEVAALVWYRGVNFNVSQDFLEVVQGVGGGKKTLQALKGAGTKVSAQAAPQSANQAQVFHYIALGAKFEGVQVYDESADQYRNAIKLDPANGILYYLLGHSLFHLSSFDDSVAAYQHAISLSPNFSYAYDGLGATLLAKGDRTAGLHAIEKAMQADPQNLQASLLLMAWIMTSPSPQRDMEQLKNDMKPEPWVADMHVGIAMFFFHFNEPNQAAAQYEAALKLNGNLIGARQLYGRLLADAGHYADAATQYRAATQLDPDDPSIHFDLASALHMEGNEDEAIKEYREVVRLDPTNSAAYNNLGNALDDKKDEAAAADAYHKALALDPKNAEAHVGLGNTLVATGKVEDGISEYQQALSANPNMALASLLIAKAHAIQHQYGKATLEVNNFIHDHPNDANGYFFLSVILESEGKVPEAKQACQHALKLDPTSQAANALWKQLSQESQK
jgi:tetratricopeptide (TPR) repeat protein